MLFQRLPCRSGDKMMPFSSVLLTVVWTAFGCHVALTIAWTWPGGCRKVPAQQVLALVLRSFAMFVCPEPVLVKNDHFWRLSFLRFGDQNKQVDQKDRSTAVFLLTVGEE